jgi:CheY-like chemotaxis protein
MSTVTRILVLEDNPADVRLLTEALDEHRLNHELHVFNNGEDALHFVEIAGDEGQPPCPDLFLLDLHLPKVDGIEVLRRFRENPHCADTPVVVFTSSLSPEERKAVAQFSGAHYRTKPGALDEFLTIGKFIKDLLINEAKRT